MNDGDRNADAGGVESEQRLAEVLRGLEAETLRALPDDPIPPFIISFYFVRVDTCSRAFVDTANTRLLLIEEQWKSHSPESHFSTYQQVFAVLSRHDEEVIDGYLRARAWHLIHGFTW